MPHLCRGLDGTREGPTRSLSVLFCVVGGEGCGRVKDPTKTDTGSVQLTTAHFLHTALNSCVSEVGAGSRLQAQKCVRNMFA